MTYDHSKYENRLRASAVLKGLKSKLIDVGVPAIEVRTMTAESSMAWWRLSKVAGVHVYHEAGGWQADVVFRNLPPGVPTIIGSPEIYATRQAALAGAIKTLSIMAATDKMPLPGAEDGYRWFKFDGIEIPIQADLIKDFPERLAAEGYTDLQVRARLARLRHELADDRSMTTKIFKALDQDDRNSIRIVCGIALALGVHQFSIEDGFWSDFNPVGGAASTMRM